MPQFQVQYKYNSKTHTINLTSDSWQKVRDFAQELINGEITEIREFIHQDDTVKKDDGDYKNRLNIVLYNDGFQNAFRLSKIKKNIDEKEALNLASNFLKFRGKTPNSIKISM